MTSQYTFSLFDTTEEKSYKLTKGDLRFLYSKLFTLKLPFVRMRFDASDLLNVIFNSDTHAGVLTS